MTSDDNEVGTAADPLLTPKELCKQVNICTKTLQRLELEGEGPRPIQITSSLVRYRQSDVDAWLASRVRTGARPAGRTPAKAIAANAKRRAVR
jgi:predicted DNA-binding transcriptional regulator AlpA